MQQGLRSHAAVQAARRLGVVVEPQRLLRSIQAGDADFVSLGHDGRLIYDVPYVAESGATVIVRALVNAEKTYVISVLPNEFRAEQYQRREKQRKKAFFRGFEGDDDESAASAYR